MSNKCPNIKPYCYKKRDVAHPREYCSAIEGSLLWHIAQAFLMRSDRFFLNRANLLMERYFSRSMVCFGSYFRANYHDKKSIKSKSDRYPTACLQRSECAPFFGHYIGNDFHTAITIGFDYISNTLRIGIDSCS